MTTITPEPAIHRPASPFESPFSRAVSLISAALLLSVFGSLLWFSATVPPVNRVEEPDQALDLMVGRMMEAHEELKQLPLWLRWLAGWTVGISGQDRLAAIQWYQELIETTDDPLSRLRLAILQAEEGQKEEVLKEIATWREFPEPLPRYAQWIEAAYGPEQLDRTAAAQLQATLSEVLPEGWFYRTLVARLAERSGEERLFTVMQEQGKQGEFRERLTSLLLLELACLILGSFALLTVYRRRSQPDFFRVAHFGIPPPWSVKVGTAVLVRGGAMGALISIAFFVAPPVDSPVIEVFTIPLANLPLLILAYLHLFKPARLDISKGFGLSIHPVNCGRVAVAAMAAIAAGLWGDWMIGLLLDEGGITDHWTEWFDADLVWGTGSTLTVSLLEYLVFAPIFEEIAFRGLLFATLRHRLSFAPAAFVSAAMFAAAHGYGLIGFLSVLWSGILWAWVYEKTGSLLPGIVAHAANNLLVSLTVMALLR
ncbi:MAG: CPBP family intramembrane metalloprotease [Nitrospira sp.]|nr:CPBP family intramembrane metalloprotease [Nitrospira sp.]